MPRELAQNILEELYELRSERDWWKDEPRCNYQRDYKRLCDEIRQMETILGQRPEATLLGALDQAAKDFDMGAWKEQDSSCLLCHSAMGLDDECEWPEDPRLLLCWSCMSNVMGELLAMIEAPNEKGQR